MFFGLKQQIQEMRNIFACLFVVLIFSLFITSCSSNRPYLYDKPGFDAGTMPQGVSPNVHNQAPPGYYQQPTYPPQAAPYQYQQQAPYPPQYQQQPHYPPQQQYTQPPQQTPPGSRFYSNPYAIPPAGGNPYPTRYDVDQYYVAPYYYNNVEPTQSNNSVRRDSGTPSY